MTKILLTLILVGIAINCFADEIDDILPFLIQVESGGNPNAISSKCAIGLCQVTPIVLREWNNGEKYYKVKGGWKYRHLYNIGDLYNPEINVMIATWYLRRLRDYYLPESSGW